MTRKRGFRAESGFEQNAATSHAPPGSARCTPMRRCAPVRRGSQLSWQVFQNPIPRIQFRFLTHQLLLDFCARLPELSPQQQRSPEKKSDFTPRFHSPPAFPAIDNPPCCRIKRPSAPSTCHNNPRQLYRPSTLFPLLPW